jgi:tRNA(Ile)-lysidine synthase
MLVNQVREYCVEHSLFEPGIVVVAVSGGADSLTLLHVLQQLCADFGISLHVATLDHGIRGDAGAADVDYAQRIAAAWGVPVTAERADVPAYAQMNKLGIEAAAREVRYNFLRRVAESVGSRIIAVGHNQDDQAETVLFHAVRGAGSAGLRGMLPRSPFGETMRLVRPLLNTPRRDIDTYMQSLHIVPRTDATNTDTTYTRNQLRHTIMPLLESLNPAVRSALARTADVVRDEYEVLCSLLPPVHPENGLVSIALETFDALPIALQRLWIRAAVNALNPNAEVSYERTEAVVNSKGSKSGIIELGGGLTVQRRYTRIEVSEPPTQQQIQLLDFPFLEKSVEIELREGLTQVSVKWWLRIQTQHSTLNHKELSVALHVPDGASLHLHPRRSGDRIRLPNGGSQKISDFLINAKVPVEWRDRIPLLTINGDIVWCIALNASRQVVTKSIDKLAGNLYTFSFTSDTSNVTIGVN